MESLTPLILSLLPVLYGLSGAGYARLYASEPEARGDLMSRWFAPAVLRTAVAIHLILLIARGVGEGHLPLASIYDFLSATAFSLGVVYVYLETRQGIQATGIFVLPLVLLIQLIASAYGSTPPANPPQIRPIWFEFHTLAAVLGYSALAVSAIYGILFLALYREIKASRLSRFFRRMPSLETLAQMNIQAVSAGLVLLALAILMGMGWAHLTGVGIFSDAKTWGTLAAWLVLAFAVLAYHRLGWRGPQAVYASLAGFMTLLLSRVAVDLFFRSFHSFQ